MGQAWKFLAVLLLGLLLPSTQAWWFWGDDEVLEEGFKEQLEKDLAGVTEGGAAEEGEVDEAIDSVDDAAIKAPTQKKANENRREDLRKAKEQLERENKLEELKRETPLTKQDEDNIDEILSSPQLAMKLDREAFEKKLDEVLKTHEALHRGKEVHFGDEGEHNDAFDHELFLGDEAEQFKHLTPEEAGVKLGIVVEKIDKNNDTLITEQELTEWIASTAQRGVQRRVEEFWGRSNPEGRAEISWEEYRAIQYGFLTDGHITVGNRT